MSKKKNDQAKAIEEEGTVIEMTDDEGNVFLYTEEMIIELDGERYAILVELPDDEEDYGDDEEPEVIIAKIVVDENGEDLYIEPDEEEFERVQAAYDKLFDEEESKDEVG